MGLDILEKTVMPEAPLGQKSPYPRAYDKGLLFPVSRLDQRQAMGLPEDLVLFGFDVWNAYELYWLDMRGKPVRSVATIVVPVDSPNICESKSLKLYLNSLNHHRYASEDDVAKQIASDVSELCGVDVRVLLSQPELRIIDDIYLSHFRLLDDLKIDIEHYRRRPELLWARDEQVVSERVSSHLFKSHCLCTGQPDMGSIFIEYTGPKLDDEGLLAYIISYRDHVGFSENCIEQIFADITLAVKPTKLSVHGRFTRRGGIDINPYRANHELPVSNCRLFFQ